MAQETLIKEYVTRYEPDLDHFRCFQDEHRGMGSPVRASQGQINNQMSWRRNNLKDSYVFELSALHLSELSAACFAFEISGLDLDAISQSTFRLPTLASELQKQRRHLQKGCGIVLFKGVEPSHFSRIQNVIIFAGLAAHMSEQRGVQAAGKILVHIKDLTSTVAPDGLRMAPYTNTTLPFHTDHGDTIAMYALGVAQSGGEGLFVPVATIYNDIMSSRPDLIDVLRQPNWPFDRAPKDDICDVRPVLFMENGEPEMAFSRGGLLWSPSSQRPPTLPSLTSQQAEALDMVHLVASQAAMSVKWAKGDMLFFNNRKILHGRERFLDGEGTEAPRHFLRLWLRDAQLAGSPPDALRNRWKQVFNYAPRDNNLEGRWPLSPITASREAVSARSQLDR